MDRRKFFSLLGLAAVATVAPIVPLTIDDANFVVTVGIDGGGLDDLVKWHIYSATHEVTASKLIVGDDRDSF